jgi:hypothetical protein
MASWGDGQHSTLKISRLKISVWVVQQYDSFFFAVSAVNKVPTLDYVQKWIESPPSDLMWMLKRFFS